MVSLPNLSPNSNPLVPIAPASEPVRPEPIESAVEEPDIPVDAGPHSEERGVSPEPESIQTTNQSAEPLTIHPNADWWPWYAAAIGMLLLIFGGGRSTEALLLGWTVAGIVMIALPLVHAPAALRMRLIGAGAMFFAAVLAGWRLDANPDLGVLALAGNGRAVAALVVLTAALGALIGSRRWTVLQSGVWFAALAASGWWLRLASDSQGLLAAWRELLPYKQVEFSKTTFAFDTADALLLSILPAGLFAIGATAGFLIRTLVVDGVGTFHVSKIRVIAYVVFLGMLFFTWKGSDQVSWALIVLLAVVIGGIARAPGDLVRFSVTVTGSALAFAALDVASDGLSQWWGPHYCSDFMGYNCTPSQDVPLVIFVLATLPIIAAASYGAKLLLARIFGPLENRYVEPMGRKETE